jgi:hypothetical protein
MPRVLDITRTRRSLSTSPHTLPHPSARSACAPRSNLDPLPGGRADAARVIRPRSPSMRDSARSLHQPASGRRFRGFLALAPIGKIQTARNLYRPCRSGVPGGEKVPLTPAHFPVACPGFEPGWRLHRTRGAGGRFRGERGAAVGRGANGAVRPFAVESCVSGTGQ